MISTAQPAPYLNGVRTSTAKVRPAIHHRKAAVGGRTLSVNTERRRTKEQRLHPLTARQPHRASSVCSRSDVPGFLQRIGAVRRYAPGPFGESARDLRELPGDQLRSARNAS